MTTPIPLAVGDAKRQLRQRIKLLKSARTTPQTEHSQRNLDEILCSLLLHLRPRVVFAYLSTADEVGTRDLIDRLLAQGLTIVVPSLVDRSRMVATRFPGWGALRPGALGILSPPSKEPCGDCVDLVLVPGLAFSVSGARLGYGAGYYDRWLAANPAAIRVGLCFEFQVTAAVPVAEHDQFLDYLVTDRRLVACGRQISK